MSSPKEVWEISWLAILSFMATLQVFPSIASAQQKGGCEREAISMLMSPDDTWIALVYENICSDGAFVTTVTDTVQLARRDTTDTIKLIWHVEEPKHEKDVFTVDEGGHPQDRPLTRWLSPQKLQITVPNKSLIGLQKNSYEGIEVVIKFEPDDPTERERWLKSLGLAPK
jgi:hypothetical protein